MLRYNKNSETLASLIFSEIIGTLVGLLTGIAFYTIIQNTFASSGYILVYSLISFLIAGVTWFIMDAIITRFTNNYTSIPPELDVPYIDYIPPRRHGSLYYMVGCAIASVALLIIYQLVITYQFTDIIYINWVVIPVTLLATMYSELRFYVRQQFYHDIKKNIIQLLDCRTVVKEPMHEGYLSVLNIKFKNRTEDVIENIHIRIDFTPHFNVKENTITIPKLDPHTSAKHSLPITPLESGDLNVGSVYVRFVMNGIVYDDKLKDIGKRIVED